MLNNKNSVIAHTIIIIVSFLFMLLFAYNTSPLFQYIGVDSGMYLVIGKAMARGEILYSSLFDHKGPIIFIINMIPQIFIDGAVGIWVAELCLISVSAIILYKIANRSIGNILSLSVPLIYLWITVTLFNGGNYTEEYSNFFCVISLYIFDNWMNDKKLSSKMSYIIGVCITLVFFLRPNNIAFIISIIIFISIYMIKNKRSELKNSSYFLLLGVLSILLPIIIYHLYTGTLYDMFYATILHNLKYCAVGTESFRLVPYGNTSQLMCFFIAFWMNIVAICTCYSSRKINTGNFILLSLIIISVAILIGRHPFMYYWTLLAPLAAYSSIFIIKYVIKIKKQVISGVVLCLIFLLISLNSFFGTDILEKKTYITQYKINTHEMYDVIPTEEKNDCFAYNMPSMFIYEVDLATPYKYFTMQTWMSKTNPDIDKYSLAFVKENNPKWILSYFQSDDINTHPGFTEILTKDYIKVFENDCGYLYRKVDVSQ